MRLLIVLAGPNGSGKSSLRDALINPVTEVIDPDRIAREINPRHPESVSREAGIAAIQQFERSLQQGRSISLETTLSGHSGLMRMRRAKAAGYEVSMVYVALSDSDLNVSRVASRVRQGGHAIEPDIIRRRVEVSQANLAIALTIADQSIVFDNSGRSHRTILEVAAGKIVYLADQLPLWLERRMPSITTTLREAGAQGAGRNEPFTASNAFGSSTFDSLRSNPDPFLTPLSTAATLAERLASFERIAAGRNEPPRATPDEPGPVIGQKPSSGPSP